jgi:F-type H+-transporting ATPase subunit a
MLAATEQVNIIKKITDQPWEGFQVKVGETTVTLMSSGIAVIILVALVLMAVLLPAARRYRLVPTGGRNALELILIFVRDMVARPALHDKAYAYLSFLATLFVFVLGMNLSGLLPLEGLSELAAAAFPGLHGKTIGGTPTAIIAVTGALALMTLVMVLTNGMRAAAVRFHHHHHWPMVVCAVLAPVLWIWGLSPRIPGITGIIMKVPLTVIEFAGVIARCFALMIRLFANMVSGHAMLAVFLMLIIQSGVAFAHEGSKHALYVVPLSIAVSVAVSLMELLVAVIQAYVFTFLTAIFIGLAIEESH